MIEKMQFISLTGRRDDFDRAVDHYIPKYSIQLENALSELKTIKNLRPFTEVNTYKDLFDSGVACLEAVGTSYSSGPSSMSVEQARNCVRLVKNELSKSDEEKKELVSKLSKLKNELSYLANYKDLHVNLKQMKDFKFISYHFGRLPLIYYNKFEKYIYNDLDTIFYISSKDESYAYGIYFAPVTQSEKLDAIYSSLHFEVLDYPEEYDCEPSKSYELVEEQVNRLTSELTEIENTRLSILDVNKDKLLQATRRLEITKNNFELRKLAACTGSPEDNYLGFYILCGWIPYSEAKKLKEETDKDDNVFCVFEEHDKNDSLKPPTLLKNFPLFKPFEMFIRMYGMPSYDEFDPTPIVAITYSLIFGAMFGDLGQGLSLFVIGLLLYKLKKMDLAAIISICGLSSAFFGLMFGSIFGFEDIIPALWLRPISHMTNVNFIGKINTVFVIAIAFGMGIILFCMIVNILSAIKSRDFKKALLDTNGAAGLFFYGTIVLVIVLFVCKKPIPAGTILAILLIVPLLIMVFKEQINTLITKKPSDEKTSIGMFITQAFFELFEVMLSYFSNTLSFVRIGAFAVSHAAMMEVVLMLAGHENGQLGSIPVIILGNIFVSAMEGLIVGIQVLRLQYYEMFSRYYNGSGREFKPTKISNDFRRI